MILLRNGIVVLLSCEAGIAASYKEHRPVPGQFTVAQPYQSPAIPAVDTIDDATADVLSGDKDLSKTLMVEPAPAPGVVIASPQRPDVAAPLAERPGSAPENNPPAARQRKHKRKRKQREYQPNAQEQQAELRHAAYQPALLAAVDAVQAWLAEDGGVGNFAGRLAAASATDAGSCCSDGSAAQTLPSSRAPAGSKGPCSSGQADAATTQSDPLAAKQVDYIALAALRGTVHPKFCFNSGGGKSAQAPAVNLFDRLISNGEDTEAEALAHETPVLLPPRCAFLMSDITRLKPLLPGTSDQKYHLVVLDPPWENASARRAWRYPTLGSRNLLAIPMSRLLHQDDGLVALWMTNRERHWRFVETELLAAWGLAPLATWLWLKVTNDGQPVAQLDVAHRRPYEVLLLAAPSHGGAAAGEPAHGQAADSALQCGSATTADSMPAALGAKAQPPPRQAEAAMRQPPQQQHAHQPPPPSPPPPQHLVIVAVPGEHSRKPQLGRLLCRHVPPNARCLEMFARELTAGWTSWGNEPLHFQSAAHFQRVLPACQEAG